MPVALSSDPRKWIPAIVGGVILGEALWSLLQLLVRDWAVPAITNLLGQGPTQNQNAFLPQPLLIAFVQACFAGILLVLLMAWSGRRSRTLVVGTEPAVSKAPVRDSAAAPADLPSVSAPGPSAPVAAPVAVALSPLAEEPAGVPRIVSPAAAAARESKAPPSSSTYVRPAIPLSTVETAEVAAVPETPAAAVPVPPPPAPPAPPKSKKPKTVYYNIVGEPIESDD